jgi:hypothetical protein
MLKAENAAKREDGRGGKVSAKDNYGRMRIFRDKYILTGTEVIGQKIKFMTLPAGFQVLDVWMSISDEIAATSTVSVGSPTVANKYLDAVDGSDTGIFKMSDIAETGFVKTIGDKPEDVVVTLNVAVGASDETIEVFVIGSLD